MRPTLLALEDRRLLSTFTVDSTLDNGSVGTLRWAIGQANSAGGTETIDFDSTVFSTPKTITLTGSQLELSDTSGTETITGPHGGRDGQRRRAEPGVPGRRGCHRVDLGTDDHAAATATALGQGGGLSTRRHGHADQLHRQRQLRRCSGGGLYDGGGTTTLTNCTVSGNSASYGGGLYNDGGTTTLTNCTVSGNSASYGGGLYRLRRHDHADQLHRQRQLRRLRRRPDPTAGARPR